MRALILALLVSLPAFADTSDPAFRAPFERLLQSDDIAALRDLHAAAEAGNTSALLAMPFAHAWVHLPPSGDATEALFRINGTRVLAAAKAIDPVAALWWQDPAQPLPSVWMDSALALYQAGETARASAFLTIWLNQTAALEPLPGWIFDQPVPVWLRGSMMQLQLQDFSGKIAPAAAEKLVIARLMADDPAAWLAMAGYARMDHDDPVPLPDPVLARIAGILTAAGIPPAEGQRRMAEAVPQLLATYLPPGETLAPDIATLVVQALAGTPEFLPIEAICRASCPDTTDACMAAFVSAFGVPINAAVQDLPFLSLISPAEFFATPRGRTQMVRSVRFRLGKAPAASLPVRAAREIDACLADAVLSSVP